VLLDEIESTLLDDELTRIWTSCLEGWVEGSLEQRAEVLAWVQARRDDCLTVAREVREGEDLAYVLAIRYIEFKSHWIMLNTQINYRLEHRGTLDSQSAYQASLISLLMQALEPLLDRRDIESISSFLSQPLLSQAHLPDPLLPDPLLLQALLPQPTLSHPLGN